MPIESATYIADLDETYPLVGDQLEKGDDHIRLIKSVLKNLHGIGDIVVNTSGTNPSVLYGGTWVQVGQGRALIGEGTGVGLTARTAGDEIGQEDAINVSHTHSVANHNHTINHNHASVTTSEDGSHNHGQVGQTYYETPNNISVIDSGTDDGDFRDADTFYAGDHTHTVNLPNYTGNSGSTALTIDSSGSSGTDKNLPPSLVVYFFEKTA